MSAFKEWVRRQEERMTPAELAELNEWRAYYRGDGPTPAGAWIDPREPRPSSPSSRDLKPTGEPT